MVHHVVNTGLKWVLALFIIFRIAKVTTAFVVVAPRAAFVAGRQTVDESTTRLFLEDWVAEMIDNELYRQNHHKEYEEAWMKKNKGAVVAQLGGGSAYPSIMMDEEQRQQMAEHRRDEKMAFTKPEKYCADRCVATGNCDIYQDFYELSPEDVLKFCEECVLNFDDDASTDGGSGCDVPDAFYEKEPPLRP